MVYSHTDVMSTLVLYSISLSYLVILRMLTLKSEMESSIFLALGLMVTAQAIVTKPTTLITLTTASPLGAHTMLPTNRFHNQTAALTKHNNSSWAEELKEDIEVKYVKVLNMALLQMAEERHIVDSDMAHYNPWDHIDELCEKSFEHEGSAMKEEKEFLEIFRVKLKLLKALIDEYAGPEPCTVITISKGHKVTTTTKCPEDFAPTHSASF
jgi:hypothetical protein